MKFFLKTAVSVLFIACSFKAEAQSVFGESWYRGGISRYFVDVSLSPQGDVLAVLTTQDYYQMKISFYDVITGKLLKTVSDKPDLKYEQILWSKNGEFIIRPGSGENTAFSFIDTVNGAVLKSTGEIGGHISYSQDSLYIIAGKALYDADDFSLIDTLRYEGDIFAILPGDSLALFGFHVANFGSTLNRIDTITLFRFPSGEIIRSFPAPTKKKKSGFAGKHLKNEFVLFGLDSLFTIRLEDGSLISKKAWDRFYRDGLVSRTGFFSKDDAYLFTGTTFLHVENDTSLLELSTIMDLPINVAISSDYSHFYFINNIFIGTHVCRTGQLPTYGHSILVVDSNRKIKWRISPGHDKAVADVQFDIDNMGFSSISTDSFKITWDQNGEILYQHYTAEFQERDTTGISPAGRFRIKESDRIINVTGYNHTIQYGNLKLYIRDSNTDEILKTIDDSHPAPEAPKDYFQAWAWMPNDRFLLTASRPYSTPHQEKRFLKMWDIELGKVMDSMPLPCYPTLIKVSPDGKSIALATEEFGIMHIKTIGDFATSVLKEDVTELTLNFYPNPLQDQSTISCSLPADGVLKITLHDMLGREVAILHDAFKSAGNYTFPFKNENLPNGFYFLKMIVGGRSVTKSVSIVR